MVRDLTEVIEKADSLKDSEYLDTLFVVVPK